MVDSKCELQNGTKEINYAVREELVYASNLGFGGEGQCGQQAAPEIGCDLMVRGAGVLVRCWGVCEFGGGREESRQSWTISLSAQSSLRASGNHIQ